MIYPISLAFSLFSLYNKKKRNDFQIQEREIMSFTIENGVLKKYTAEPGITRVEIPEGVTEIDNFAFSDAKEITEIILPDSLTKLKGHVLCGCVALAHIHISASLTSIDLFGFHMRTIGFSKLTNLTEITVSENNRCFCSIDGVLYTKDKETLVLCPVGKNSIHIPEGVKCIGDNAFAGCANITEIRFPDSLTTIRAYAFHSCGILEADIPESVKIIETGAFYHCRSLSRIKLPDGITEIANCLFSHNYVLSEITIPESVKRIGSYAFDSCKLLSFVSLPENVSSVGSSAFSNCRSLRKIVLHDKITRLLDRTFEICPALECITIPENVTFIGENVFAYCHGLASLTMPLSVTSIGKGTFECCPSLSVIKLHPDDPDMIREYHSIEYLEDSIQTGLRIIQTGDTSLPLDRKIKYTFIVLHYLRTKDSRLKLYIQKNIQKIMKKCIACGDTDVIRAFAETDDFITKGCIEKYIQRALDCNQKEIYNILTAYKLKMETDI